jgi:hypothetical protein
MISKNAKFSNYKTFELADGYSIDCKSYETRYSWGHIATLLKDEQEIDECKFTYYNRTWESYTFESIIHSLITKHKLPESYKTLADEIGKGNTRHELKNLGALVAFAGILQTEPDKANEAQIKTLEIATGGAIERPSDWDTLSEEEKSRRIKEAVSVLK